MQKFIAVYMAPTEVLAQWMEIPEDQRQVEQDKMENAWNMWLAENKGKILETNATGKTTQVSKGGTESTSNNIMLYSIVEAESSEAAAAIFENHPHLGIPQATIDIMPLTSM